MMDKWNRLKEAVKVALDFTTQTPPDALSGKDQIRLKIRNQLFADLFELMQRYEDEEKSQEIKGEQ